MNEKNTLNILNGQSMYDYFKQYNFNVNGIYVPFNEAMCVGEVTADIFSDKFNKCRCDAHHVTIQQYNELTSKPLQKLFENQFSDIVLWFDDDMFCQINLLTILAYFNQINYSRKITFNLVDHKFNVVECFKIDVQGYNEIYEQVMVNRCIPQNINISIMEKGINLYFEYLKEENEITAHIRQHEYLQSDVLVTELLKIFPQYGLGDTQYIQLIERCRKSNQEYIGRVENGLRQEYFIKGDELKTITEVMDETCTPGVSAAVIHNFQIVWAKGYGVADIESQLPVNTNTLFQAASISKPITALAVMKLVQDGKLDLDENINTYLKTWKLPENELTAKNKVTLRNLLSHTAGVTVHGFPGYSPDSDLPTLVQVLKGELPASTGKIIVDIEPNTIFRYSGGGYTIVQQVLIDQLQKPFEEIMYELVLNPLGMANSFYCNSALREEQCANATAGHKSDGSQVPHKRHLYPEMAAAGLWTTAEDLAKFATEVQKSLKGESNKILNKEFMERMITPVLNGEYNIGLRNEKIGSEQLLGHNGANEGYSCSMMFHKENGFGVIFMSNSDSGYKMKLPFFRSTAAAYGFNKVLHPDYEKACLLPEQIKLFSGNYKMEPDKTIKIFQHNKTLFYKTIFCEPTQLDYVGNNTLIDLNRTIKLEFSEDFSKLYINENIIERLKDGEKLASDYMEEDNIDQAIRCYQELMENDNDMKLKLENDLNNAGYNCIFEKNYDTAIAFLKINTILFPESANTWDSLGEAYFLNKQYKLSIEAMKKSLEYNPNNQNAIAIIKDAKPY